jgi:integral membrane protein
MDPIITRFRAFCIAEGISWIILIAAMGVKYGMLHGVLFVGYLVTAVPLFTKLKWSTERIYGLLLAGFLPFGTFVVERKWLR